jgi:hypothetical protein
VLAVAAFSLRGQIRDRLEAAERPVLPPAQEFQHPEVTTSSVPTKPVATKPSKTPSVVATSTPSVLPKSVNLAVPFLSQAPKMVWDRIHEDTCEEASIVMVEEFYAKAKTIDVDAGDADLVALVDKQMEIYGRFESTSATETERLVKTVYGNPTQVQVVTSIDDIKVWLAKGYPVIAFADGKALKNPNFRNGGPAYHALVVKGYLADGRFITNDPGTRKGADYVYDGDLLFGALHDWNGGNVKTGAKRILVVLPK